MSVCDKNCWDCVFRTTLSFYGIVCNFLGVMGRRRGCPAGKDCQEKIKGKKRESLEARLYRMPPNPEKKKAEEETLTPSVACGASSLREGAKAEEAARIAEKKRKKAEQHRAWVARNREHLREYQQEYRKKKMENEALTPSGAARQQTARPPQSGGSPRAGMLPQGGSQDGGAA